MSVTAAEFVASAEEIRKKYSVTYRWNYAGYKSPEGIYWCDCRGYVIWALRRLGVTLSSKGTNRMIRTKMQTLSPASSTTLEPGMLVFKARAPGDPGYDLPSEYKKVRRTGTTGSACWMCIMLASW